ncbi:DUF4394 domain-containing protein [Paracoccus sp. (in: a-proteobacteria)]|uniref:DUF4394 domain-containing protein n=1 Tax=Paracoccus sp. TaxID=267 RepID=UPI00396C3FA6
MIRLATFSTTALALSLSTAAAAPALGLAGDRTLIMFDTDTLAVTGTMEAQGVERLHGLDLRSSDNSVIGVTGDNRIVTIDPSTGETAELSVMDTALTAGDMPVIVDVNPMADRLRLMSGTTNHRVNMDTGEVTVDGALNWTEDDANSEAVPMVVASGYTNSHGKPEATAMYNIDAGLGALLQQIAPNDGTLATIGLLNAGASGNTMAFDVQGDADGNNMAWLLTGNALYSVDLETGTTIEKGPIERAEGDIRDFAVLPAM